MSSTIAWSAASGNQVKTRALSNVPFWRGILSVCTEMAVLVFSLSSNADGDNGLLQIPIQNFGETQIVPGQVRD